MKESRHVIITLNNNMKLKNFVLIGMMILGSSSVFSQQIDNRLLKSYEQTELQTMLESDKDKYDLLVYALDNGLQEITIGKGKEVSFKGTISLPQGKYTFADLGLKIEEMEQYYKIEGKESVLMVKSFTLLNRLKNGK